MAELQALVFDVDGTLADTEEVHRQCFNQAFAEKGIAWEWSPELYGQLLAVTGGKERICHYVTQYHPDFVSTADLPEVAATLHQTKTAIYTQMLADGDIPLRPGVERLLREALEQGTRLAIATTTTPANVEALINNALEAGAMDWFDVVGAGDIVPRKKPASDIYDYVLQRLGLTAEQCMAFEDSENGLRASTGANLSTVVTVNHYTKDHDFKGAAIVLDQMGEPGRPFKVLSGNGFGHTYLNLALIQELHSQALT